MEVSNFRWGEGFWGFLSFSMQMTLIIATGYIVASAPAAKRFLVRLCKLPEMGFKV